MVPPIGIAVDGLAATLVTLPSTQGETLSVLLGMVAAVATAVVRYRYSTEHALISLGLAGLAGVSPLAERLITLHPVYFVGGFATGLGGGLVADYLYTVVTGESTGVAAFRDVAADWIDRLRDRRRSLRRRLESILDRKTIIAVLVGMPLSEFVKVTVVQLFAADPIQWRLAWAHLTLMLFGLAVGVHWEHIKSAASDAGEQAEELVDGQPAD